MIGFEDKIFLGILIMLFGGSVIVYTVLSAILLSLKAEIILDNFVSMMILKIVFAIIGIIIVMYGYYYKGKNERLFNEYQEKHQIIESEKKIN
jgi:hypothetical protein